MGRYLELHIEQGKVLEEYQTEVGIVGTVAGPIRYRVYLRGMAEHSGATPMDMRSDALCAAAEIILIDPAHVHANLYTSRDHI